MEENSNTRDYRNNFEEQTRCLSLCLFQLLQILINAHAIKIQCVRCQLRPLKHLNMEKLFESCCKYLIGGYYDTYIIRVEVGK